MVCSKLLGKFDSTTYNSVDHFDVAKEKLQTIDLQSCLSKIRGIFIKHGMQKRFGLRLNHKHFDLKVDELLVEGMDDSESLSVSVPWRNIKQIEAQPLDVQHWEDNGLRGKAFIAAHSWVIREDATLQPYEFYTTDKPMETNTSAPEVRKFLSDLAQCLNTMGVLHLFGLSLRHWEAFYTLENTCMKKRANITRLAVNKEEKEALCSKLCCPPTPALWYFDDKEAVPGLWCAAHCSHCTCHCCHGGCCQHK
jgi:hypothetical protein